jgi:hypothetical protein
MVSVTETNRENPSSDNDPPISLSLWEALGEEYWSVKNATADAKYEEFRSACLKARTDCGKAQNAADKAQAKGDKEPYLVEGTKQYEKAKEACEEAERNFANHLIARFHQDPRDALCFSGGGIRSASFCLGVLQALAWYSGPDSKLFSEFHYLSTVSGGGYTGGWLSSWITRAKGTAKVVQELRATRLEKLDPEPKPLLYLRNFVSYLNPRLGALSADTWTLISTVLRNVILNWLVLIPLLAAALALPQLMYAALAQGKDWGIPDCVLTILLVGSGIFAAVSTAYIVYDLPKGINAKRSQGTFLRFCMLPLLVACLGLTVYWAWHIETGGPVFDWWYVVGFVVIAVCLGLLGGLAIGIYRNVPRNWFWIVVAAISTLVAAGLAAFAGYHLAVLFVDVESHSISDLRAYTWLAVPVALAIIAVMQLLTVGLTSRITEDEDREWWARSTAWLLLALLLWLSLAGIVLYGTRLLHSFKMALTGPIITTALGGIASRLGSSSKTNAGPRKDEEKPSSRLPTSAISGELALKLIVPAFLVLLVVSLASVNEALSTHLAGWRVFAWWQGVYGSAQEPSFETEGLLILLLGGVSLVAAVFVNVNKFSLHAMYRLRLIRSFLGASVGEKRAPSFFTGFDPADNLAMADLHNGHPFHVVNIALNLVKGEKLAWQQRKAESFTVTRLHSGSCRVGYQHSDHYGRTKSQKGITLGGAITISGAAASPNMGYHSSPLVTIIMTLFNARLGVWLANPGKAGKHIWDKEGPTYAVRPFIDEAFGLTTDTNAWVYLSDGGHFENLGLYEMVLRRCRNIVVVDASADPGFTYEDLGNAIRKIRIDMGIPVEFREQPPIPKIPGEKGPHWAVGEIQYSCVDGPGTDGILLYVKPCLNGNEPTDVVAYSKLQPTFPHQSTVDQWFDEPQFESYRRLGFHSIDELLEFRGGTCGLSELLQKVVSRMVLQSWTLREE